MHSQTSSPAAHARALTALGWAIAVLASAFIAFCTAVGPIYRADASIVDFDAGNALRFMVAFVVCMGIVVMMARPRRVGRDGEVLRLRPAGSAQHDNRETPGATQHDNRETPRFAQHDGKDGTDRRNGHKRNGNPRQDRREVAPARHGGKGTVGLRVDDGTQRDFIGGSAPQQSRRSSREGMGMGAYGRGTVALRTRVRAAIVRGTDRWWRIALILLVCWAWVPVSLGSAYGYDVTAQITEFANWWAWLTGAPDAPDYHAAFTTMDVYPIAHYLWPDSPTWLTNQHNIVLTLLYGGVARWLGAGPGLFALSAAQFLFAVFVTAATADRVFQPGGRQTRGPHGPAIACIPTPAGPVARVAALAFLAVNPLVWSATISLTKSPLFAFGFLWSFGLWHQLVRTGTLPRHGRVALALSTLTMLASAKYGVIVVAVQCALGLVVLRRHRRLMVVALLVPAIAFQGALAVATSSGAIMGGDPIEGNAIQVQQIARIARRDPDAIPAQARERLERIFDLDAMATVYNPDDADPAKSSGGADKHTSYRWRTVTADDMDGFTKAWLAACAAAPVDCWDAFAAEWYGYFDVTDPPYVAQTHYVAWPNEGRVPEVAAYHGAWRARVVDALRRWSSTPVLGWLMHANLWTVLTLLAMCAQAVRRRWMAIMTEVPLLMQMAVAAASPANNFERHMLGVVLAFAFVMVASARDARDAAGAAPTTVEP